ncbi:MAG TPA: response regulator transcription factor [Solirubrobacteraceae bacterium]
MRILVVEDDDGFAAALRDALAARGYRTSRAGSAAEALDAVRGPQPPDLVLLDLGLPDGDGLQLCAGLRRLGSGPIIVVTARGDLPSRVQGLRGGADDYLVKPFAVAELLARIEAVMRRVPAVRRAECVTAGDVAIDLAARTVMVGGAPVMLTVKEFDLLAALARALGQTIDRQRLLLEVWQSDYPALSRSLDVHMATLRAKLGRPELVQTVRGVGYRLADISPAR